VKVKIIDDDNMIVYLSKCYIENINFTDKDSLEIYFKDLFKTLQKKYDINISGYYDIDVYIDNYYGVIIEMMKEDLEYYNYFDDKLEMQIVIHDNISFLYLYKDYFDIEKINDSQIYKYKDNYYLKIDKDISNIEFARILEFSDIIYRNTDKIAKKNYLIRI